MVAAGHLVAVQCTRNELRLTSGLIKSTIIDHEGSVVGLAFGSFMFSWQYCRVCAGTH